MLTVRSALSSILLLSLLLIFGCSNPKNYEVTKLTDDQKKELGQSLTAEEGQKLAGWMMRNAFSGKEPPAGTTVAQALAQQDDWIAKQKAEDAEKAELAKRVEAERKAKQEEFAKLLAVALVGKTNNEGEYSQKWVGLDVAYENKSNKDIQGAKGVLKLKDIFGDKIMNISWSYDGGIPAKQSFVERGSGIEINQFMDDHKKLWNTEISKLKSTYEVTAIIFQDGSRIDAPE